MVCITGTLVNKLSTSNDVMWGASPKFFTKNLRLTSVYKGKNFVILNEEQMDEIISDECKFKKLQKDSIEKLKQNQNKLLSKAWGQEIL